MTEVLSVITGILNFWPQVVSFIKLLQGTPAEQIDAKMAQVHAAFQKAEQTGGDTSDIESSISS